MIDSTRKKDGLETKGYYSRWERWLFETRLYMTSGESLTRSIIWFITWLIGIHANKSVGNHFIAIPNFLLIASSYAEDVVFNKMTQKRVVSYKKFSNIGNMLLFFVAGSIVVLGCLQLSDYFSQNAQIDPRFYNAMYWLSLLLILKPVHDFVLLGIYPKSFLILYEEPNQLIDDERPDKGQDILTKEHEKDLQDSAKSGALTSSKYEDIE